MLLEMFVNEISLVPAVDVSIAQERAREFILTMTTATSTGVKRRMRLPVDFYAKPLAQGYYWQNWLGDNRVERELRQYFRSLATQIPFLHDEPDVEAASAEIDCLWQNQSTLGLKAAYIADGLALSILSDENWNTDSIECEIQEVIDDDVSCRNEVIHHASSPRHLNSHTNWIHQRIQHTVDNGRELWNRMDDFFPSLICCSDVERQMIGLPNQSLASIVRGLFHLNAFNVGWLNGPFDSRRIDCDVSPESESTLQMYAAERTFLCPNGERHVFSWHAKLGRWRVYFDPSPGPGRVLIGYVGSHLGTVKYN